MSTVKYYHTVFMRDHSTSACDRESHISNEHPCNKSRGLVPSPISHFNKRFAHVTTGLQQYNILFIPFMFDFPDASNKLLEKLEVLDGAPAQIVKSKLGPSAPSVYLCAHAIVCSLCSLFVCVCLSVSSICTIRRGTTAAWSHDVPSHPPSLHVAPASLTAESFFLFLLTLTLTPLDVLLRPLEAASTPTPPPTPPPAALWFNCWPPPHPHTHTQLRRLSHSF